MQNIEKLFNDSLILCVDQTETAKLDAFRIRHQVYCQENNFEDFSEDKLETDEYDMNSLHIVVYQKIDMVAVGSARIIFPKSKLPIENFIDIQKDQKSYAEISRFSISKKLRKENSNLIRLALIKGLIHLSVEHDIIYWYALMEPSFLRLLKMSGIIFQNIGEPIEYRGLRQPVYEDWKQAFLSMQTKDSIAYDFINQK